MADRAKKVSELTAAASAANTDYMVVVANTSGTAVTKRITVSNYVNTAILPIVGVYHSNTTQTIRSANGQGVNIISNNFSQIHYNPSVTASDSDTNDSSWAYVTSGGFGAEAFTSATFKSGVYAQTDGVVVLKSGAKEFRFSNSVPASASSTGSVGQIAYDSDYIYICVATNTWKRASLTTW